MSDSLLDPQEMEAIQAAIRETAPTRRGGGAVDAEPRHFALIVDDRTAEAARPVLLSLANRAAKQLVKVLKPHLPGTWQLDVVGGEIVDGTVAKAELRGGWVAGLVDRTALPSGSAAGERSLTGAKDAELVVAAQGSMIELAVAKRCGAATPTSDASRAPSSVSLRLFQPAGRTLLEGIRTAYAELFDADLSASSDLGVVSRLIEPRPVVRVTLAFSGSVTGRIQMYARPEVLVARPAARAAFKANALRVAQALANVPVEIVVELGTLRMRLRELRNLQPGANYTLQGFVDSLVPVYCEGVLKAWARPVVCRGVLAVQIESVVHGQGSKS